MRKKPGAHTETLWAVKRQPARGKPFLVLTTFRWSKRECVAAWTREVFYLPDGWRESVVKVVVAEVVRPTR